MTLPAGIIPILYAFFNGEGKLCRESMRRQVKAMVGAGVPALAILGLATEVNKLTVDEQRCIIDWALEDIAGKIPLFATINGMTVADQAAMADYAERAGAAHLIFQPPAKARVETAIAQGEAATVEAYCLDFFRQVLGATKLPSGIQNAPEYLGVGLSPAGVADLAQSCPSFRFLKGEGPSVLIERVISMLGGDFPVFNGRGGQELVDNLRAGCRGMVVAPDTSDWQQRIVAAFQAGDELKAEALYRDILPAIIFVMQSIDSLICYGKRIAAWRLGFDVMHDRAPALAPTAFGLEAARRFAEHLGPITTA